MFLKYWKHFKLINPVIHIEVKLVLMGSSVTRINSAELSFSIILHDNTIWLLVFTNIINTKSNVVLISKATAVVTGFHSFEQWQDLLILRFSLGNVLLCGIKSMPETKSLNTNTGICQYSRSLLHLQGEWFRAEQDVTEFTHGYTSACRYLQIFIQ